MSSFATVAELAAFSGRELEPENPSALLALSLASDLIRSETQNQISLTTTTVQLDGDGRPALLLPHAPLVSVESVTEDGVELVEGTDYFVSKTGFLQRNRPSIAVISSYWLDVTGTGQWSGKSVGNIVVTYTHGYAETPGTVKLICLAAADRIVATYPTGVRQETIGSYSVTYANASPTLLDSEIAALDPYRNVQAY